MRFSYRKRLLPSHHIASRVLVLFSFNFCVFMYYIFLVRVRRYRDKSNVTGVKKIACFIYALEVKKDEKAFTRARAKRFASVCFSSEKPTCRSIFLPRKIRVEMSWDFHYLIYSKANIVSPTLRIAYFSVE